MQIPLDALGMRQRVSVWKDVVRSIQTKLLVTLINTVCGKTHSVLTTSVLHTIPKMIVTEMMNVFGSTARMSVFRIVLRVTTMRHPVTLILDVDGMPRQEVESVPRIARIRTVTRRVVSRIRSVVCGSMTRQHVLRVAVCRTMMKRVAMLILVVDGITMSAQTQEPTTVTELFGWSRISAAERG